MESSEKPASLLKDAGLKITIGLILAIASATIGVFVDRAVREKNELSYAVTGATTYLSSANAGEAKIQINDVQTSSLVGYQIKLWNSGDKPISDAYLHIEFNAPYPRFRILQSHHVSKPPDLARSVSGETIKNRYVCSYRFLNPGEEDVITILTNGSAPVSIRSRMQGVVVKDMTGKKGTNWLLMLVSFFIGVALMHIYTSLAEAHGRRSGRRELEKEIALKRH